MVGRAGCQGPVCEARLRQQAQWVSQAQCSAGWSWEGKRQGGPGTEGAAHVVAWEVQKHCLSWGDASGLGEWSAVPIIGHRQTGT